MSYFIVTDTSRNARVWEGTATSQRGARIRASRATNTPYAWLRAEEGTPLADWERELLGIPATTPVTTTTTTTPELENNVMTAVAIPSESIERVTQSIRDGAIEVFLQNSDAYVSGRIATVEGARSVIERAKAIKANLIGMHQLPWEHIAGQAFGEVLARIDAATTPESLAVSYSVGVAIHSDGNEWSVEPYRYGQSYNVEHLVSDAVAGSHVLAAVSRIIGDESITPVYDPSNGRMHLQGLPSRYGSSIEAYGSILSTGVIVSRDYQWRQSREEAQRRERMHAIKEERKRRMNKPVPTHDTFSNFVAWRERRRASVTAATPAAFAALPLPAFAAEASENNHSVNGTYPPENPGTSRTWGIEIEHVDAEGINAPHSSDAHESWDRKFDSSLVSYNGGEYDCLCEGDFETYLNGDYRTVTCGELGFECDHCSGDCDHSDDNDDSGCYEFVSPVLKNFFDDGLSTLLSELDGRGSNDSAGVHVHIGAKEFRDNIELQSRLVYSWALIEPILIPVFERNETQYAQPFDAHDVLKIKRAEKQLKRERNDHNPYRYRLDRYRTMNVHAALDAHGTIEFRAMGPVYREDTLIRWAHLCRRFVEFVATHEDAPDVLRRVTDLSALVAAIGWEEN